MSDPEDVQNLLASNVWVSFDLTDLTARWVANPGMNHGVLLKGPGAGSMYYKIPSSNYTISIEPTRLYIISSFIDDLFCGICICRND